MGLDLGGKLPGFGLLGFGFALESFEACAGLVELAVQVLLVFFKSAAVGEQAFFRLPEALGALLEVGMDRVDGLIAAEMVFRGVAEDIAEALEVGIEVVAKADGPVATGGEQFVEAASAGTQKLGQRGGRAAIGRGRGGNRGWVGLEFLGHGPRWSVGKWWSSMELRLSA